MTGHTYVYAAEGRWGLLNLENFKGEAEFAYRIKGRKIEILILRNNIYRKK